MPSKKKARGKARRATKSRKAKEGDGVVNDIDSEFLRLQMSNNKDSSKDDAEDEDALLEAAINLAAAEREELEAAAENDEANNSQICYHGLKPIPTTHVSYSFMEEFVNEYNAISGSNPEMIHLFEHIYEATKTKYAQIWNDPDMVQRVASHFIISGTNKILERDYYNAAHTSMFSSVFEQLAAIEQAEICTNKNQVSFKFFLVLCDWGKIFELHQGDEHTLVSFFRKRITCYCLDNKYKEVKSITKIGFCYNASCSLPGYKTARSEMLSCTQCRRASYCSRECQVAHWPKHKQLCTIAADYRTVQKWRQKK